MQEEILKVSKQDPMEQVANGEIGTSTVPDFVAHVWGKVPIAISTSWAKVYRGRTRTHEGDGKDPVPDFNRAVSPTEDPVVSPVLVSGVQQKPGDFQQNQIERS